jgi:hypothetical protein
MHRDQTVKCRFEDELAALIAPLRTCGDERARHALFDALMDLEGRARTGGASDLTLRKIAEVRFLTGILREAVRPYRTVPLRTILRMRERRSGRTIVRAPEAAEIEDR